MIRRYLSACVGAALVAALAVSSRVAAKPPDLPEDGTFTAAPAASPPAPTAEVLPMPHEDPDITCPYLRQQMIDRHACQLADPEMGCDVLENLERLKQADNLLELAKELAREGFFDDAMECCADAAELCPGSPCAERAVNTMHALALGIVAPTRGSEEIAEPQPASDRNLIEQYEKRPWDLDPNFDTFLYIKQQQSNQVSPAAPMPHEEASGAGVELMVSGLMKACRLLMNQGMQQQAADLARQAYALDPQRVQADPLIYKMHLLAESSAGTSEESEPPTCPTCGDAGKYEIEIDVNMNSGLRMCADCSMGDSVYHLRFKHGCLSIWKTPDAGKSKP